MTLKLVVSRVSGERIGGAQVRTWRVNTSPECPQCASPRTCGCSGTCLGSAFTMRKDEVQYAQESACDDDAQVDEVFIVRVE